MGNVISLTERISNPHLCIRDAATGNCHVMPVGLVEDVAGGVADVSTIPSGIIMTIIKEWLDNLKDKS